MAWLDPASVKLFLGLAAADTADDATLADACLAVEAFVQRARPDAFPVDPGTGRPEFDKAPTADAMRGATQLAGRLYQRRGSSGGIAGFNDLGGAVYVSKYDPDIERLLRIGFARKPGVG